METLIIIVTFVFICLCIVAVFYTRNAPIKKTAVEYATKYTEADTEATRKALRGFGDGVRRTPNNLILMPKICEGSKFELLDVKWVEVEDWLGNFYTINLEDIDTENNFCISGVHLSNFKISSNTIITYVDYMIIITPCTEFI